MKRRLFLWQSTARCALLHTRNRIFVLCGSLSQPMVTAWPRLEDLHKVGIAPASKSATLWRCNCTTAVWMAYMSSGTWPWAQTSPSGWYPKLEQAFLQVHGQEVLHFPLNPQWFHILSWIQMMVSWNIRGVLLWVALMTPGTRISPPQQ